MGLLSSKSKTVQTTNYDPRLMNYAYGTLDYLDHIYSGVNSRYAGGPFSAQSQAAGLGGGFTPTADGNAAAGNPPPSTFIAPFSQDTQGAHSMARTFANDSRTPDELRALAGQVADYRGNLAGYQSPDAPD
ncbi:MAG: hypothetical protein JNK21_10930, partial [Rhodospirillaceae bacterium]|nr:hypothetical protein [Rhodospirillaceae bacterium]